MRTDAKFQRKGKHKCPMHLGLTSPEGSPILHEPCPSALQDFPQRWHIIMRPALQVGHRPKPYTVLQNQAEAPEP